MNINISLTGSNSYNPISLTGMSKLSLLTDTVFIKRIKKRVFSLFIIPLYSGNWNKINENMFRFDELMIKLIQYNKIQPSEDLQMYINLLSVISELTGEYINFSNIYKLSEKGLAKLEQILPTIRLSPEYELYNLICGKPDNKIYEDSKIYQIKELLKNTKNITFDEIKNKIL